MYVGTFNVITHIFETINNHKFMSETNTASPETGQSQTETNATTVSDRLQAMYGTETTPTTETTTTTTPTTNGENKSETPNTDGIKPEPTAEELAKEAESLKAKVKELGLEENATKEQIEAAEKAKADTEWQLEDKVLTPEEQNDGTWKGLIESLGLEAPADYNEEQGFEYFEKAQKSFIENEIKKGTEEAKYDRFSDVPEEHRPEAEMIVELLKSGATLQQINEPFVALEQFKAMSKEELVRTRLMTRYNDEEVVDHKMEKIIEDGKLDLEYKEAKMDLDNYEQNIGLQRKQQIETFKNNQKVIQEQRANKANLELKVALDRVPEFLGKKLPDNIKSQLLNELQSDAYRNMAGTPEQKVDYFLYNKFGKTAMKAFQDRVTEKVVVEHKQNIHNVPIKQTGSVNRVEESTTETTADKRVKQMYG